MQSIAHRTRTQKLIAAGVVIAIALLTVQAYALARGGDGSPLTVTTARGSTDPSNNSTVTVIGTGQVGIEPNEVILSIGVTTQSSSAQTAAEQNANTTTSVISSLEHLGINSTEIQTVSYQISPETNYNNQAPPSITGYQVANEVQVTIAVSGENISQLGTMAGQAIDAAVAQGANDISGVEFTASQTLIQQATNEALQQAVQNASSQAKTIATALGVSVTGVVSISTDQGYVQSPVVEGVASASTPIEAPQSLTITSSVQAVYALT